jgi:hypothetical protein
MVCSELKKDIDIVTPKWDVSNHVLELDRSVYLINTSFYWSEQVIDCYKNKNMEYIAEVPYKLNRVQAFEKFSDGNCIELEDIQFLKILGNIVLSDFLDTENYHRNGYWK